MGQLQDECGHNAEAISETEAEQDSGHRKGSAGVAAGLTYVAGRSKIMSAVVATSSVLMIYTLKKLFTVI